jgi:predicted ATP-dependent endonuclease of OLD family
MIVELQLTNYRGFQSHTIPFRKTSIIVGPNNAGKSTVIEALRLLSIVSSRFGAVNFNEVPRWLDAPRAYRGFSPSLKGIDFNDKSIFYRLGEPPAEIKAIFDNGVIVNIFIGRDADIFAIVIDDRGKIVTTKGQAQRVQLPSIGILPQVTPISREELLLATDYARRIIPATWSSAHFRNQIHLYREYYNEMKQLVESTWKDLRIVDLEVIGEMPQAQLMLTLYDSSFGTEAGWVGHGLQMWLQTMWFLARSHDNASIILDEPDVYMHADLQRKLIRLLKGLDKQIIVATHSVEIMSEVEPAEILVVNRRSSKSGFADSVPYVQSLIRSIGSVHNLQLARIWNAHKLILVEGPDDVKFLRILHRILFSKSAESFEAIPIIELGGWSGWKHATGYPELLKNAFEENIITYCIFDSDYFTAQAIDERVQEASKKDIKIHIWRKKEMENYFLTPTTVQRIVSREMRKDVEIPSVEYIDSIINVVVDGMKGETVDNISTCIQQSDRKLVAGTAHRMARQKVESLWGTEDGQRSIVCGKDVISRLSEWAQQNYGVTLNGERILKNMTYQEIDQELKQVITAIEKGQPLQPYNNSLPK